MTDPLLSPFSVTGVYFLKYTQEYDYFYTGAETEVQQRYYFRPSLISGLGIPTPNLRTKGTYRLHGEFFSGLNIPNRTVVLTIPVLGNIQDKRAEIYDWFSQDPVTFHKTYYDMYLEFNTGKRVLSKKVVLSGITETLHEPLAQFLNVTFFCPDPLWYGTTLHSVTKTYTYAGPPDTVIDEDFTVPVVGTGMVYPRFIVIGSLDQFSIENTDTDQFFGPLDLALGPGEMVTINTDPTVTAFGVYSDTASPDNLLRYAQTPNLSLWLDPGFPNNHISYDGFITVGTATVTIEWFDAYIGV
jgi:hypothetical protein